MLLAARSNLRITPEEEDSNGGDSPSEREEGQAVRLVEANLVS